MSDQQWTVGTADEGVRLDKFLSARDRLGSRGRAMAAVERGKVFRNDAEQTRADAGDRLATGDTVRVWMDRPGSATRRGPRKSGDLQILYEDESLIAIDKPAGLLAVPLDQDADTPSVVSLLERHLRSRGKRHPLVVHRIDRDTSGVVVFAKDPAAHAKLKGQFKRREPERTYWAVVSGHLKPSSGEWRDHLVWDKARMMQRTAAPRDARGVEAVSDYRVIEEFAAASLVEVRLRTGRQNQIRMQAWLRGHPLIGERRYVGSVDAPIPFPRQALHAVRLAFRHPSTGQLVGLEAPMPQDLRDLIDRLRRAAGKRVPSAAGVVARPVQGRGRSQG